MQNTVIDKQPLVSVIMPVFNAQDFLAEAIESIVNQTYKNIELIIVDDKSTDNSWQIIKEYQAKYPKIVKPLRLNKRVDSAGNGAANIGFKQAKGEFIARMDADDISLPQRIAKQVCFMKKHPNIILQGTQAYVIDASGKIMGKKNVPISHQEIYKAFGIFHPMIHPSCMIRRKLLPHKDRIYENKFGVNDDYYTFFKFLNYGQFANLSEPLIKYRIHDKNASLENPREKFINSIRVRTAAIRKFGYKPSVKAMLLTVAQIITVFLLPQRLVVPVYMKIRGINRQPILLARWRFRSKYILKKSFAPITKLIV